MHYFDVPDYYSNSFLTKVACELLGKPQIPSNASFFKFGTEYEDCLLYGQKTSNKTINQMVKETKNNSTFRSLFLHPDIKIQHEFYGKFMGLPFKAKADGVIKGFCVPDIKSTSCTDLKSFIKSIHEYDYDRQMYVYMNVFKCESAVLIATSKSNNPKVFVVPIKKNDYLYNSGQEKTKHLISVIKAL